MITSEYIEFQETTIYSVNDKPISQCSKIGKNLYETVDYLTGAIYESISNGDSERLALQMAMAYAYAITEGGN